MLMPVHVPLRAPGQALSGNRLVGIAPARLSLRQSFPTPAMSETATPTDSTAPSPCRSPTAILVNRCEVRLWSLAPEERLRRALARCGVTDLRTEGEVPAASTGSFILLRTDFLLEDSLVEALVRTPDCLLVAPLADGTRAVVAA